MFWKLRRIRSRRIFPANIQIWDHDFPDASANYPTTAFQGRLVHFIYQSGNCAWKENLPQSHEGTHSIGGRVWPRRHESTKSMGEESGREGTKAFLPRRQWGGLLATKARRHEGISVTKARRTLLPRGHQGKWIGSDNAATPCGSASEIRLFCALRWAVHGFVAHFDFATLATNVPFDAGIG
jgi:hypothetical protein